jgi:acetyl-CoA C-acetyltransferase
MKDAVIVGAARSPIGRALKGSLTEMRPDDMAVQMIEAALAQVPELDPHEIEDLHLGCGEPYDEQGGNMARRVAVQLGIDGLPGTTVNRYCTSSLQTTRMAMHAIRAGEGMAFISAGARTEAWAKGNDDWVDPRLDGMPPDIYISMGQTAENVATATGICRREQDEFATRSQRRAEQAIADGFFARDITPLRLPDGDMVRHDDGPRPGTTYEKVAALKPSFRESGTVTAGNTCPLNDGAAALVVMEADRAREQGIEPLARIVATGVSALSRR